MRDAGYLSGGYPYQERVLSSLMLYEQSRENERKDSQIGELVEAMFLFLHPEPYKAWKRGEELVREEEGVDRVIYQGPSQEAYDQLMRDFGMDMWDLEDLAGE